MRLEHWFYTLPLRFRSLFCRRQVEEELSEELEYHIEQKTDQYITQGMDAEQARRAALRDMDGLERHKEECRDMRRVNFIEDLLKDLQFGLRQLRRNPGFTAVAIITLALGIGANGAIFSVLYRDLLRPLPYPYAKRLVMVGLLVPELDSRPFLFSPEYLELRQVRMPFESMASWKPGIGGCDLAGPQPIRLSCARVESTFLPTFGVHPVLGRNFTAEEERAGAPQVCLISYGLWQSRFGGNPAILGQLVSINGKPTRIVGALPHRFEWPTLARVDVVLPEKPPAFEANVRPLGVVVRAYARLKAGVSIAQARAELQPVFRQFIQAAPPMFHKEIRLGLISVREDQVGSIRLALWVLFGATLALLLLAGANVTNILSARNDVRQRELAIRAALGASRWRLTRLRLIESILLGLGGGITGSGLAFLFLDLCVALAPSGIPRIQQMRLGFAGGLFIAGASVFAGILCGLGSSLAVRPSGLVLVGRAFGPPKRRLPSSLVILQVAVSFVLLVGAGLLLDTLRNIANIPLGMDTNHIVTAEITLGSQHYSQPGQAAELYQRLETELGALPGVTGVAVSDSLPPHGSERARPLFTIRVEGRQPLEKGSGGMVGWRAVSPGYFKILRIPIVQGRGFLASDQDLSVSVMILNKSLAARLFHGEDPIGQRVQLRNTRASGYWYTVVGVAGDVKWVKGSGRVAPASPEYYVVRKSATDLGLAGAMPLSGLRHAFFLVRTPLAASSVERMVQATIAALDSTSQARISTFDARVDRLRARPRFDAVLISLFAILGLLLAATGVFGLVSYSVAGRTHEIGIRMALGAQKRDVLRLVLGQGMMPALIGVAIGIAGALGLTRFLSSLLYGVKPTDPLTFVIVSVILSSVALLACYIPARRAMKVNPMVALRYE